MGPCKLMLNKVFAFFQMETEDLWTKEDPLLGNERQDVI